MIHEQFILYYSLINKSLNKHLLKSNVKKNQCGHWHDTKRRALSGTLPCQDFCVDIRNSPDWIRLKECFCLKKVLLTMKNEQHLTVGNDKLFPWFHPKMQRRRKIVGFTCPLPYLLGRALQFLPQTSRSNTSKRMPWNTWQIKEHEELSCCCFITLV